MLRTKSHKNAGPYAIGAQGCFADRSVFLEIEFPKGNFGHVSKSVNALYDVVGGDDEHRWS